MIRKSVSAGVLSIALVSSALLLFSIPSLAQEGGKKLTLEDIINPMKFYKPRPSGIMWLPGGDSFLYFFREERQNFLWRYDCATGEKTKLADWGEIQKALGEQRPDFQEQAMDDVNAAGRFLRAGMKLSPDGSMLLASTRNDLYLFEIESGKARFITNDCCEEIFAFFSPDGEKVAFIRNGDLYMLELASGEETRLTKRPNCNILNGVADWVYEEELRPYYSFCWAPDSRRIAFLQYDTTPEDIFTIVDHLPTPIPDVELQKYPKPGEKNAIVRLGVIDTGSKEISWLNTGADTDVYIPRIGWLPDGSSVWYQWLNRDQSRIELRLACTVSGNYKTIVRDEDPAWVVHNITIPFVDDERFIWTSERDGWRHYYLYKTDGTLINQITKGEWEVDGTPNLGPDGEFIIFRSTKKCLLQRHLYRVNLDGTGLTELTSEEGTHSASIGGGNYYIHSWSSPTTPSQMEICKVDGEALATIYDGHVPALDDYNLAIPEYFTVKAEDSTELHAMMIKPPDFDPENKYPVLVRIYGGPTSQMVRKTWFGSPSMYQLMAQEGVIIFSIENRGSVGRGRDFNRIVHRNLGHYEVIDHVDGVKYLKTLPYIDGERIGIYGGSYGGYMVLMTMLMAPDHFQVGVSSAPVTDWRLYDTIYTERYMDTPQDNPEGYRVSAPLNHAENFKGRLLLVHGTMDNNVHMQNTIQMSEALIKAGKDFQLMLYPRSRHGIRGGHRQEHRTRLIYNFLMRELKVIE